MTRLDLYCTIEKSCQELLVVYYISNFGLKLRYWNFVSNELTNGNMVGNILNLNFSMNMN